MLTSFVPFRRPVVVDRLCSGQLLPEGPEGHLSCLLIDFIVYVFNSSPFFCSFRFVLCLYYFIISLSLSLYIYICIHIIIIIIITIIITIIIIIITITILDIVHSSPPLVVLPNLAHGCLAAVIAAVIAAITAITTSNISNSINSSNTSNSNASSNDNTSTQS